MMHWIPGWEYLTQKLIRWAIRRSPDFTVGPQGNPYLDRWHILPRNRWCNLYLHRISRSDEPVHHDHEYVSCSLVLRGGYREHFLQGERLCREGDLVCRKAATMHWLELYQWPLSRPCWTLFLTGPRVRSWGFLVQGVWVHHTLYKRGVDVVLH